MEDKIEKLYNFLKENRHYNKQVQEGFIKSCIAIKDLSPEQKVLNLLYGVVNTQSQPKMDKIGKFFKNIYENKSKLATYNGFLEAINPKKETNSTLFQLLKDCPGWGSKTAALFVKTIYLIHNDTTYTEYVFWENSLLKNLELKLPVDAVITHIFKNSFLQEKKQSTFVDINKFISNLPSEYSNVIIWDELWFWGFITQQNQINPNTNKNERINVDFNENKFLCLPYVEKDIDKIKEKAKEFLEILEN